MNVQKPNEIKEKTKIFDNKSQKKKKITGGNENFIVIKFNITQKVVNVITIKKLIFYFRTKNELV